MARPTATTTALGAALLLGSPAAVEALSTLRGGGAAVLSGQADSGLRPEVVAQLFGEVAHSWVQARAVSAEDAAEGMEASAQKWAVASCGKVAGAVVKGSQGEVPRVHEYMRVVCSETDLLKGSQDLCMSFADGLEHFMAGDGEYNRALDTTSFCAKFYAGPVEVAAQASRAAEAEHRRAAEAADVARREEAARARAAEAERLRALEAEATAAATSLGAYDAEVHKPAAVDGDVSVKVLDVSTVERPSAPEAASEAPAAPMAAPQSGGDANADAGAATITTKADDGAGKSPPVPSGSDGAAVASVAAAAGPAALAPAASVATPVSAAPASPVALPLSAAPAAPDVATSAPPAAAPMTK